MRPVTWTFRNKYTLKVVDQFDETAHSTLVKNILKEVPEAAQLLTEEELRAHEALKSNWKPPVLIAKLRAGFVISGFELSDIMGSLVQLTYFHSSERRKLLDVRVGITRPTGRMRELFF